MPTAAEKVSERESGKERDEPKTTMLKAEKAKREREGGCVCVRVCVCVTELGGEEIERERERARPNNKAPRAEGDSGLNDQRELS